MNVMRRVMIASMMACACRACGAELPDVAGEWRCVKEQVVPLIAEANNENLGRMVYRDYEREAPFGSVQVILSEGSGTGSLYVPEKVNYSEGVMPSGSGYRLLVISGHNAILENHAYMPVALAVNAGDNVVLTIEAGSLTESETVRFAEEILSSWKDTDSGSYPAR